MNQMLTLQYSRELCQQMVSVLWGTMQSSGKIDCYKIDLFLNQSKMFLPDQKCLCLNA